MGFSVSGSFAVIAIATFMALGMVYSSAAIGFELVREAQQTAHDDQLDEQNTGLTVIEANWTTGSRCGGGTCLIVEANNTGATALSLNATDLIVDGHFIEQDNYQATAVDDDGETDLWLPGETYHVEVGITELQQELGGASETPPKRVKLVTENGVADAKEVS